MTLVEAKMLMTPKEVAAALSLGLSTTCPLLAAGVIPSVRIGRSIRIVPAQLKDWVLEKSDDDERA